MIDAGYAGITGGARAYPYGQNRWPACFGSEPITALRVPNEHSLALRQHRNQDEMHREWLRQEKRSVCR